MNGIYTKLSTGSSSHDPSKESADIYVDTLLNWIDDSDGQWAACLNLMDAHSPYVPSPEHDIWGGDLLQDLRDNIPHNPLSAEFLRGRPWGQLRALEALYDGCIHQLDQSIARLVDALRLRDELNDTLLIITSDHGEAFGERSRLVPHTRLLLHASRN
jgi:arylsulfatase A-like enzyme